MEELLRGQRNEAAGRRTELEQTLVQCRGQLQQMSREREQLVGELAMAQKVRGCVISRYGCTVSIYRGLGIWRDKWPSWSLFRDIPHLKQRDESLLRSVAV